MVEVHYGENRMSLPLLGVVSTGSSEDSQLLVPLPVLQALTSQPGRLSLIELAAPGSSEQVEGSWQALQAQLPEAEVRPLRPVVESEARVVMKVRNLMLGLAGIVLALVILSVLATVSGLILDRQKDIGVMKALGGSDRSVAVFFLAEMAFLALLAAAIGYGAGFGLAQWAAQRVFQSAVELRADVLGAVVAITLAAALIATVLPTRWIRRADPAIILRGD
jgi:putative ABC transport system permease protein